MTEGRQDRAEDNPAWFVEPGEPGRLVDGRNPSSSTRQRWDAGVDVDGKLNHVKESDEG